MIEWVVIGIAVIALLIAFDCLYKPSESVKKSRRKIEVDRAKKELSEHPDCHPRIKENLEAFIRANDI